MMLAWLLCGLGLLIGAGLGAYALFWPRTAAKSLGFAFDPQTPGGMGEARAFGGFIIGAQIMALAVVSFAIAEVFGWRRGVAAQAAAMIIIAPAALVWMCAGAARIASIFADKDGPALNWRLAFIDLVLALMIAMPWATLLVR